MMNLKIESNKHALSIRELVKLGQLNLEYYLVIF